MGKERDMSWWKVWYYLPLWVQVEQEGANGEFIATIPEVGDLEGVGSTPEAAARRLAVNVEEYLKEAKPSHTEADPPPTHLHDFIPPPTSLPLKPPTDEELEELRNDLDNYLNRWPKEME